MKLPAVDVWLANQAVVDELLGRVVEIQKDVDQKSILEILRVRLGYTSNRLEGNSFSKRKSWTSSRLA